MPVFGVGKYIEFGLPKAVLPSRSPALQIASGTLDPHASSDHFYTGIRGLHARSRLGLRSGDQFPCDGSSFPSAQHQDADHDSQDPGEEHLDHARVEVVVGEGCVGVVVQVASDRYGTVEKFPLYLVANCHCVCWFVFVLDPDPVLLLFRCWFLWRNVNLAGGFCGSSCFGFCLLSWLLIVFCHLFYYSLNHCVSVDSF